MYALAEKSTFCRKNFLGVMPFSYATVAGGICGGTLRTFVEIVAENMKVRKQTDQRGRLFNKQNFTRGLFLQWIVSSIMFTTFVTSCETLKKKTNLSSSTMGNFLIGGLAGTFCWAVVWPIDMIKSQTIAQTGGVGGTAMEKLSLAYKTLGVKGLFRGFGPG